MKNLSASRHGQRILAFALACVAPAIHAQIIDSAFQPAPDDQIWMVAGHPDGGVLAGGFFRTIDGLGLHGFTHLDDDGHVAPSFRSTVFHSSAWTTSVLADDRLLVGGDIGEVDDLPRRGVVRLLADGAVDPGFGDPGIIGRVYATAEQADGRILAAGDFTQVDGHPGYAKLVRLNADGSLDTTFNPGFDDDIDTMVLQPDGRVLVGGYFRTVNGEDQKYLARINPDGSLDTTFRPRPDSYVWAIALQVDGRILAGGQFSSIGAADARALARLNADGSRDGSFADPGITSGSIYSIVPQADGKLIVSGSFTGVAGFPRNHIARINGDGSLDTGFGDLDADFHVDAIGLQPDGRLLLGGAFTRIGGMPVAYLARAILPDAAQQSLDVAGGGSRVTWLRSGAAPELMAPPVAYRSTDGGATWTRLGSLQRIAGGWRLAGLAPIIGQPFRLRVDGLVQSGYGSNSQGRVRVQDDYRFDDTIFEDGFDGTTTR